MDVRPTSRREIGALTGIRFAAAALVLISHTAYILVSEFPALAPYAKTMTVGDIGVGVFFFLSGYILTYTYGADFGRVTRRGWQTFMRRRFARVWPLQAATLLALVAVDLAARSIGHEAKVAAFVAPDYGALPSQLTLTHAWAPWGPREAIPWNPPSWSISAEWSAYVLAPFAMALLLRLRIRFAAVAAVALVTAQFVLWKVLLIDSGITRIFGLFFLGAFCYVAIERTRLRLPRPDLIVGLVCVALVPVLGPTFNTAWRFFIIVASGLLIVPLAQSTGPIARVLGSKTMLFWGRVSFALYMTHWPLVQLFQHVLVRPRIVTNTAVVRLGGLAVMYAVILAVAAGAYLYVERPLERRLRRPWRLPFRERESPEVERMPVAVAPTD